MIKPVDCSIKYFSTYHKKKKKTNSSIASLENWNEFQNFEIESCN